MFDNLGGENHPVGIDGLRDKQHSNIDDLNVSVSVVEKIQFQFTLKLVCQNQ